MACNAKHRFRADVSPLFLLSVADRLLLTASYRVDRVAQQRPVALRVEAATERGAGLRPDGPARAPSPARRARWARRRATPGHTRRTAGNQSGAVRHRAAILARWKTTLSPRWNRRHGADSVSAVFRCTWAHGTQAQQSRSSRGRGRAAPRGTRRTRGRLGCSHKKKKKKKGFSNQGPSSPPPPSQWIPAQDDVRHAAPVLAHVLLAHRGQGQRGPAPAPALVLEYPPEH